ncbi:MAG: hypothetical protein RIF32_01450, partial [Leptospirales bacterium]
LWMYRAPDDSFRTYYSTGRLAQSGQMKAGTNQRTGTWQSYASDGERVTATGDYLNGLRQATRGIVRAKGIIRRAIHPEIDIPIANGTLGYVRGTRGLFQSFARDAEAKSAGHKQRADQRRARPA